MDGSRHYWHVGLQGGAVSPFISEQKVPVPSLKYFFLCYSEQVIPAELWGFTDFPLSQPLHRRAQLAAVSFHMLSFQL